MRNIYIMCGLPGSGKSTWINNNKTEYSIIISKDDLRTMIHGKYAYIEDYEPIIDALQNEILRFFLNRTNANIIIDETNVTKEKRKKIIDIIKQYSDMEKFKINIVWCTESENNLKNRMKNPKGYSKKEWKDVIEDMKNNFEKPKKSELLNRRDEIIIHKIKEK